MKTSVAVEQSPVMPVSARRKPRSVNPPQGESKPLEAENDSAADFLVGALLYSLFAREGFSELLPDGNKEE